MGIFYCIQHCLAEDVFVSHPLSPLRPQVDSFLLAGEHLARSALEAETRRLEAELQTVLSSEVLQRRVGSGGSDGLRWALAKTLKLR